MAGVPGRFSQLRLFQNIVCIIAMVAAFLFMGLGVAGAGSSAHAANWWMIAAGGFALFIAIMLLTFAPLIAKMESTIHRQLDEIRDLTDAVSHQSTLLESIVENTRISDAAKSLAHRGQELEALRSAIREDVRNAKWELALNLIEEMERRFGYKEEADRLREEVDDARRRAIEARLREAIQLIERHFDSHEWDRAEAEIDRLLAALPEDSRVISLRDRASTLKAQHKRELMLAWEEAVRRSDTDHAIDVLKELDQYLSPAEAQTLQASARDVFKEKLLQRGVQFRFAVTEKRWADALSIGLDLIREFPNSRMASEVRDVLDTLRDRARAAAEEQAAGAAPRAS